MSSVEHYQQNLLLCLSSNDPTIQNAAQQANEYTEMMKQGRLSKEEYMELLQDIQRSANIDQNMAVMEAKEQLNVAINGLVNIASLL
jgi:polyhydroxyalkanoate synthesis regulator phasin